MWRPEPQSLLAAAERQGLTLGTAESLTGGAVCASLVDVAGASSVVRGSIVAYQVDLKAALLGVPESLLLDPGPVSEEVALAMAVGARGALDADVGLATTGVAGPDAHGGFAPGTVWVAVATETGAVARRHQFAGSRDNVRALAVDACVALALEALGEDVPGRGR